MAIALAVVVGGCYVGVDPAGLPGAESSGAESGSGPGGADESTGGGPSGETDSDPACEDRDFGPAAMRWLSRDEYANTVRDLVGLEADVEGFPDDSSVGPFASNTIGTVSQFAVEQYMLAAEDLAARAALPELRPCTEDTEACATDFVRHFGRRAYRRPLTAPEVDAFVDLWRDGSQELDFEHGLRLAIRAFLLSPDFLYLVEVGSETPDDPGLVRLGAYEFASRLSYFLWNSMPDDELLDAAEVGEVGPDQINRLLADPRLRQGLRDFHRQWLGLQRLARAEKDPELYPEFGAALAESMLEEVDTFVVHVVEEADARLETLLTASYSFADPALATLYGVAVPDSGAEFRRIEFEADRRSGLLTQAGLMTELAGTHDPRVTIRGKFVRERLLCQQIAPAPGTVDTDEQPAEDPLASPRERWEKHVEAGECNMCHRLMDPIGFGFDHYDAIGRWRDTIEEWPVDATGYLGQTDNDGPFDGAVELAALLAASDDVHRCVAEHWLAFALAREPVAEDRCAQDDLEAVFVESRGDLRDLLAAIAASDILRYRRLPPPQE